MQLEPFGERIWIYEGSKVSFYGFPFPTRMTVVKLSDNNLFIHSPEALNDELRSELSNIGHVKYLISPNKLHHLFLQEWIEAYPNTIKYSAPGLAKKRKDVRFDFALSETPEKRWEAEIDQTIFRGSPALEEVVFYHKISKTLILTDLIENLEANTLNWWQTKLAQFAGILSPNGKTPIDWRVTFLVGGRRKARKSLNVMLSWQPENIILSHGECVLGNAEEFLAESFKWLSK